MLPRQSKLHPQADIVTRTSSTCKSNHTTILHEAHHQNLFLWEAFQRSWAASMARPTAERDHKECVSTLIRGLGAGSPKEELQVLLITSEGYWQKKLLSGKILVNTPIPPRTHTHSQSAMLFHLSSTDSWLNIYLVLKIEQKDDRTKSIKALK